MQQGKFICRSAWISFGLACLVTVLLGVGCGKKATDAGAATEATMADLNKAYAQWEMISVGPPPKTVEGLTNSYVLRNKRLPTVPDGKKLALDPSKRQVVIVDQ